MLQFQKAAGDWETRKRPHLLTFGIPQIQRVDQERADIILADIMILVHPRHHHHVRNHIQ